MQPQQHLAAALSGRHSISDTAAPVRVSAPAVASAQQECDSRRSGPAVNSVSVPPGTLSPEGSQQVAATATSQGGAVADTTSSTER